MRSKAGKAHPGSESGTFFRTNRSSRLSPAHQGVKIGVHWLWKSSRVIGTSSPRTNLTLATRLVHLAVATLQRVSTRTNFTRFGVAPNR